MNKFCIIFIITILSNTAYSQSSFNMSLDSIKSLFSNGGEEITNTQTQKDFNNKYSFINSKKDTGIATFTVTCTTNNGTPIPEITNLQVSRFKTQIFTYDFITKNNKYIKAPINNCIIIEN